VSFSGRSRLFWAYQSLSSKRRKMSTVVIDLREEWEITGFFRNNKQNAIDLLSSEEEEEEESMEMMMDCIMHCDESTTEQNLEEEEEEEEEQDRSFEVEKMNEEKNSNDFDIFSDINDNLFSIDMPHLSEWIDSL
jgi:hypothetical protein